MKFTSETMFQIFYILKTKTLTPSHVVFDVLNPDYTQGYAGKKVLINEVEYIYRGFKAWTDLAEILLCKMRMPKESTYPCITLTFEPLVIEDSFHQEHSHQEKYGIDSHFSTIYKMEEPAFLYYYQEALKNVFIKKRTKVLNLGVNRGDEFEVLRNLLDNEVYKKMQFVGIDYAQSTIDYAKNIFPEEHMKFYAHDIKCLDQLKIGRFNLLISIGTLQSVSPQGFKTLFMDLIQKYLEKDAAIILGFPNSRWLGGEMVYGAKAPHYSMNEMSILLSDIMFCKKYLQQKKYRVTITGKHYLFLTATKIIID